MLLLMMLLTSSWSLLSADVTRNVSDVSLGLHRELFWHSRLRLPLISLTAANSAVSLVCWVEITIFDSVVVAIIIENFDVVSTRFSAVKQFRSEIDHLVISQVSFVGNIFSFLGNI